MFLTSKTPKDEQWLKQNQSQIYESMQKVTTKEIKNKMSFRDQEVGQYYREEEVEEVQLKRGEGVEDYKMRGLCISAFLRAVNASIE